MLITESQPYVINLEGLYKIYGQPKNIAVALSVHTLSSDFIFTIKQPVKYAEKWHLNESNTHRYSFQCKSGKGYIYGYNDPDFYSVCGPDHRKHVKFTLTLGEKEILADYALWSKASNGFINQTRKMKNRPHAITITMNGFIENVQIYSFDDKPPTKECPAECANCIGKSLRDCIQCVSGYELIQTYDGGAICVKSFNITKIILYIALISTCIFLVRLYWSYPKVEKEYRCKNHRIPATYIVQACGHLVCDTCVIPLKDKKRELSCPICLEDTKAIIRLSEDYPKIRRH